MKKTYESPELYIFKASEQDVIATSGQTSGEENGFEYPSDWLTLGGEW